MKEDPLDSLLRSVPEPTLPEGHGDALARRVVRRIRTLPESSREDAVPAPWNWNPFRNPTSGLVAAFALALVGWGIHLGTSSVPKSDPGPGFGSAEAQDYREVWNQFATLFPHQVRAVTFGPEGPRVILSDQPDLPDSPGILVRLCSRDGCRTALTVSGQSVELGSQRLEILGTARGEVFVTAGNTVWPLDRATLRLSALNLESTL